MEAKFEFVSLVIPLFNELLIEALLDLVDDVLERKIIVKDNRLFEFT